MSNFIFTELQLANDKPFDALTTSARRGGPFIDKNGLEVEVSAADLETMLANTRAAIESTRTEGGELVGLPIDAKNHDKGDAAGWIVNAELVGDLLRLTPRWTALGIELIKNKVRRLFSATVNITEKVIAGGTLTNWPAVRAKDGRMLLRPIELSDGLKAIDFEEESMSEVTLEGLPSGVRAELMEEAKAAGEAELAELRDAQKAEVRAELEAEFAELEAQRKREASIAEFCANVTGANGAERGLAVNADRLAGVMAKLGDEDRGEMEAILTGIVENGLVEFEGKGHAKKLNVGREQLGEPTKELLRVHLASGGKADAFFEAAGPILGEMEQYDLSWVEEK